MEAEYCIPVCSWGFPLLLDTSSADHESTAKELIPSKAMNPELYPCPKDSIGQSLCINDCKIFGVLPVDQSECFVSKPSPGNFEEVFIYIINFFNKGLSCTYASLSNNSLLIVCFVFPWCLWPLQTDDRWRK